MEEISEKKKPRSTDSSKIDYRVRQRLWQDFNKFIYTKWDKIFLTACLFSLPMCFAILRRKTGLFRKFDTTDYLRASMISSTMIENHRYLHLNLIKCANMVKTFDKVSYKEKKEVIETYVVAQPRSLFRFKKEDQSSRSITYYQNIWEQDREIVRIELAGIKHPYFEDTINYLNSTWFPSKTKYECLIHSYDYKENILKVWAFYRPFFSLNRQCLNLKLLKEGKALSNPLKDVNPLSHEEIHDLIESSQKLSHTAKIDEVGVWGKYKSSLKEEREYGKTGRAFMKAKIYRWLESKFIRF
ncbi:unnamed protein product [Moneuplotes crassus]|uniref:Uncharacterized protein n=1 Tax=Euplotes crassus TaxID=5936 RepID=A0AAD2CZR1_EUPCR|nr:unnamed protein product [Moneuplotes crassus]